MRFLERAGTAARLLLEAPGTRFVAAAMLVSLLLLASVAYLLPRFERERALEAHIEAEVARLRFEAQRLDALDVRLSQWSSIRADPSAGVALRQQLLNVQSEFGRIEALLGLAAQTGDYHARAALVDSARDASTRAIHDSSSLSRAVAGAATPFVLPTPDRAPRPRGRSTRAQGAP